MLGQRFFYLKNHGAEMQHGAGTQSNIDAEAVEEKENLVDCFLQG